MSAPQFAPPGAGQWNLDRSHFPGGTTPIMQWLLHDSVESAYRKLFPILGIPAETLSVRFVNGFYYSRLRPLIGADKPASKPPPSLVLRLVTRLHPEFRRRTAAAARTFEDPPAAEVIDEWHATIRPGLVARNLQLQDVEPGSLDDDGLVAHLEELLAHIRDTYEEHFRLHGYDLGPLGMLLQAGVGWGIPAKDMVDVLAGASPSTAAPLEALAHIRRGLADVGANPTSLEEVRAASPEIADELTTYLRYRGSVLFAGYDLDSPTLAEAPHVVLATILNDVRDRRLDETAHQATIDALRQRVPAVERDQFDELLHLAREAMDLRDDNGPITAEWPSGLLRLAMLEAGRRLVAQGRLYDHHHVMELDRHELPAMVRSGAGPSADEVAQRAAERSAQKTLVPPLTLGEPEAPPPLDSLPGPLARSVSMVQLILAELGMAEHDTAPTDEPRLAGTGVGAESVVGTARVAASAEEAFDVLEPGEILVTRTTSPAYNMVLTLVGGLVTAEGGPMCHAAVLSRELNIPAVVGAADAMEAISDGARIEVDPVAGMVRVLS